MKVTIAVVIGVTLAIGLYFAFLSVLSRKQPVLGLEDGKLLPCPGTPNCVCSEYPKSPGYVSSLPVTANEAWDKIKQVVVTMGGEIMTEKTGYLRASFTTRLFRYVDDVELRLDKNHQVIHIRSASRVGHSDMGLNKKRVARMRAMFDQALDQ